ncbi:MAG: FtsX-like permease family protein [Candidatus Marinimicrobia bacterium]|nr:FtsX-like permease family protein [Candidatus Neomarinimicrobiota bacterium]MBT5225584.1 FtsX-like permease family protein [Candidatus Neomarinimicrobiota bacterium]
MRSLLTALGVVIGILAVTLMGTLISGLDRSFEQSMDFLGKDVLYIRKFEWFGDKEWWEMRNRPNIKIKHADLLRDRSQYAKYVAPVSEWYTSVKRGDDDISGVRVTGTTNEYALISTAEIDKGRFFSNSESHSGSRVAVIGKDIKDALFENEQAIGNKIRIGNYTFRVIGEVEKQGKFLGMFSMDKQIIIPLGTHQRLFTRRGWTGINVKVDGTQMENASEEITAMMRQLRHVRPMDENNFALNKQDPFKDQYAMIKLAIGGTGLFITILSLVVGGIGIANIMFVTVKERTREIGVRKALGATPKMILAQFLMESVTICLFGGLLGMGLAWGGSFIIDQYFPSDMPLGLAITALGLSTIVGVISGLAPSYKAAKLDPIDALRYE